MRGSTQGSLLALGTLAVLLFAASGGQADAQTWRLGEARASHAKVEPPSDFVVRFSIPARSRFQVYAITEPARRALRHSRIAAGPVPGGSIVIVIRADAAARLAGRYVRRDDVTAFAGALRVRYQTFR